MESVHSAFAEKVLYRPPYILVQSGSLSCVRGISFRVGNRRGEERKKGKERRGGFNNGVQEVGERESDASTVLL